MDKPQKQFWITLGVLTFLRLLFIGQFELSPDEAYYWAWSRHLDWAYYDQGPMLALVIRFFTWITHASTEWSVRLGAVVLSFFSAWMLFDLVRRMFKSTQAAWLAFVAMQASLLFSAGSILMMHDSIMVCFWIASLLMFYRAFFEDWIPGLYLGALAMGLGALSKYSMALFAPCLLIFLLLSRDHRPWLRRWQLYAAGIVTLACITPLLAWNAAHGSATFGHIAGLGGAHKHFSLSFKTLGEFVGGQLGVLTPILGALALAAPVIAYRRWRQGAEDGTRQLFLAAFSAPVIGFFLLLSLNTSVYANWPAPGYVAAWGLVGAWVAEARVASALRKWFRAAWILGGVLTLIVHLEVGFGLFPLPSKAASSVDRIRGWKTMGEEAGKRWETLKSLSPAPLFLAARRYQVAAELSFYMPGQPEVELIPKEPLATNQYRFWNHAIDKKGQRALYVCEDGWEIDHLRSKFARIQPLPPYEVLFHGRRVREILFFQVEDFSPELESGYAWQAAQGSEL